MSELAICAWQKLELGTVITQPGNAAQLRTGDWKTLRPETDTEKCIKCGMCSIYCPEFCISENEEGYYPADLFYCKGCGICANECPKQAISMVMD
ncbi:4Fe-4S binding protein [Desulfonatronovibrio magnus]|uniref:4Fe-4S binding protein n=1 Tax=Desulfonatronovibrio magnus TaxID=698827 RepID=UPI0005EB0714|nr:4Fe-4S binding protein [Desulfonatronovibrio magnus]